MKMFFMIKWKELVASADCVLEELRISLCQELEKGTPQGLL